MAISIGFTMWAHLYWNYNVGRHFVNVNVRPTFRNYNTVPPLEIRLWGPHSQYLQCGSTFCDCDHVTHIYELQSGHIFCDCGHRTNL